MAIRGNSFIGLPASSLKATNVKTPDLKFLTEGPERQCEESLSVISITWRVQKTSLLESGFQHSVFFNFFIEYRCRIKMPSPLSPAEINYELAHSNDNRASNIVVSSVICISLATIAVMLRLLARRLSKAKILADDYMMIFALVSWERALFTPPNLTWPNDMNRSRSWRLSLGDLYGSGGLCSLL